MQNFVCGSYCKKKSYVISMVNMQNIRQRWPFSWDIMSDLWSISDSCEQARHQDKKIGIH